VRAMSRGALGTLGGFILQSWSEVYGAPIGELVDAETADVVRRGTAGCFGRDAGFGQVGRLIKLSRRLRDIDVLANPRWADLVARNAAPVPDAASAPVKLVSAVEDSLVADGVTRDFATRACAAGARLAYVAAEDAGHSSSAFRTAEATIAFIADRFAGREVAPCDAAMLAAGSAPAQP
jgi:Secretory lipase